MSADPNVFCIGGCGKYESPYGDPFVNGYCSQCLSSMKDIPGAVDASSEKQMDRMEEYRKKWAQTAESISKVTVTAITITTTTTTATTTTTMTETTNTSPDGATSFAQSVMTRQNSDNSPACPTCPVCFVSYTTAGMSSPRVVDCHNNHVFCLRCIAGNIAQTVSHGRDGGGQAMVTCMLCQNVHSIPGKDESPDKIFPVDQETVRRVLASGAGVDGEEDALEEYYEIMTIVYKAPLQQIAIDVGDDVNNNGRLVNLDPLEPHLPPQLPLNAAVVFNADTICCHHGQGGNCECCCACCENVFTGCGGCADENKNEFFTPVQCCDNLGPCIERNECDFMNLHKEVQEECFETGGNTCQSCFDGKEFGEFCGCDGGGGNDEKNCIEMFCGFVLCFGPYVVYQIARIFMWSFFHALLLLFIAGFFGGLIVLARVSQVVWFMVVFVPIVVVTALYMVLGYPLIGANRLINLISYYGCGGRCRIIINECSDALENTCEAICNVISNCCNWYCECMESILGYCCHACEACCTFCGRICNLVSHYCMEPCCNAIECVFEHTLGPCLKYCVIPLCEKVGECISAVGECLYIVILTPIAYVLTSIWDGISWTMEKIGNCIAAISPC